MLVKIREYRGYMLNMIGHELVMLGHEAKNLYLYEIELKIRGNAQINLHSVKPEEIEILKDEE